MSKLGKILLGIIFTIVILVALLLAFLSFTEYKPKDISETFIENKAQSLSVDEEKTLKILSWNIGYGGLDEDADFFMDGGKMVNPVDENHIDNNLKAISKFVKEQNADFTLLQEVDRKSSRTDKINEVEYINNELNQNFSYAQNFLCKFVPYPMPPIGTVDAGVAVFSDYAAFDSERYSLPCPFKWPIRTANMKRCLLKNRYKLENGKELIIVNLHLEAYDEGEGKAAQTEKLIEILEEEYEKGNYVIAGGDFNQTFPKGNEVYPVDNSAVWTPGTLSEDILPEGWQFAYDTKVPSCRLLDKPYTVFEDMQHYVLDGFITSPNVEPVSVKTNDLKFKNSDHNPVILEVNLK